MHRYIRSRNLDFQGDLIFSYGIFNSLNIAYIVLHLHTLALHMTHTYIKLKEILL